MLPVVNPAQPLVRGHLGVDLAEPFVFEPGGDHRRQRDPRCDGIDADAIAGHVERGGPGQAEPAVERKESKEQR